MIDSITETTLGTSTAIEPAVAENALNEREVGSNGDRRDQRLGSSDHEAGWLVVIAHGRSVVLGFSLQDSASHSR